MVFEGLPIQRETLFAVGALLLFVEAALGLVAEPLLLQHLSVEVGNLQIAALVSDIGFHVADDVTQNVEADKVDGSEGRRLRPTDGRSSKRVDIFNG